NFYIRNSPEINDSYINYCTNKDDIMKTDKANESLQIEFATNNESSEYTRPMLSLIKHLFKYKEKVPKLDKGKPNISVQWVVKCNQAFNIVKDDKLKAIFTYLEPQATTPSADSIK
ncbi:34454_t:CDS:2, partial [Racocetra persica]